MKKRPPKQPIDDRWTDDGYTHYVDTRSQDPYSALCGLDLPWRFVTRKDKTVAIRHSVDCLYCLATLARLKSPSQARAAEFALWQLGAEGLLP